MAKTIFGRIVNGEVPCKKVCETDLVLAFHDHAPCAPVHILIIPKKEIKNLSEVGSQDWHYVTQMFQVAQKIAEDLDLEDYRIVTNNGENAGQTVFHFHLHLIGGRALGALA